MTDHTPALTDERRRTEMSDQTVTALTDEQIRQLAHEHLTGTGDHCIIDFARALLAAAPAAQPDHFGDVNKVVPTAPAAQPAEQCDQAFDDWYAAQRHQLTNEQVCRLIWTRGWEARGADNPEMDGTDAAHPAWWRSHDHTFAVMCEKLEKLLDGDPVVGATEPRWQRIRERIAALVTQTATPPAPSAGDQP